ncbi:DUF2029 domain-containing protein [Polymorphobacter arshaanensis]|uniref:DUF2029 domain-containing protein n=1 Tax=Glacieibacterium arshaanense TaxID=2511025 RepID=A0A4Y9EPQ0_9SPHN|nr:glycosyltransferase family 39 protein [Polymorphobacter arshaanensis]TFU03751.1 DUF2029 domain-containing protein [Polymorphobacter arshaanensis]
MSVAARFRSTDPMPAWAGLTLWSALALWLAVLALMSPVSHDENQYVAAVWLAQHSLPFIDFLYLQTPLQPLLFNVLVGHPGQDFIVLRLANAVCGLLVLMLVHATQRRLDVPDRTAWVATLALAGCTSFLFDVSVARNDVLPALLLAAATWLIVDARTPLRWAAVGVALGLAASSKISFGFAGATVGGWLLFETLVRRRRWSEFLGYGVGGIAGLLPALYFWHAAPAAFMFGVMTFGTEGVFDWYRQNGLDGRLTQAAKLWQAPWYLAQGPALAALLLLVWRRRTLPKRAAPIAMLLIGGIIGALAPTPIWKQYFMPALIPLFVLTGLVLAGLPAPHARRAKWLLLAMAAVATIGFAVSAIIDIRRTGAPAALRTTAEAQWIGQSLRAAGYSPADGKIASFTPLVVIDSGFDLDPRFATGVFVFRSGNLRSDAELAAFHAISSRTLDAAFAAAPPLAIVTGYEHRSPINRQRFPDEALNDWAARHGYRQLQSPVDSAVLWLRPAPQ